MFNSSLDQYIDALFELQKMFFALYLKRDYLEHYYVYEKKIHCQHQKILSLLNKLPKQNQKTAQQLHELVIAQGHLRFRVKDFATFEIIDRELSDLCATDLKLDKVSEKISALEDMYHTTLQVVASDPLVFYIFIQAIKDFYQALKGAIHA